MSDYGTHPTRYGNLNNDTLYSMYHESVYSKLNENEKLDLLQETVNKDALERGELGSPKVEFVDMPSNISGKAENGVISVNRNLAVDGIQVAKYNEQTIEHAVDDYNVQALNTVLHENVHCFQDQVINGTIRIDNTQLIAEYQANNFTESVVLQDQGYQLGNHYLTGETPGGYYMYYFQATERDAYLSAEKKTENILQGITEKYGPDASFIAYEKSVSVSGYQAKEGEAVQMFQNPNFVKDLNQTLQNQYFGSNISVDPATEKAVKAEMIESCRIMQQQIKNGNTPTIKEENKMNFDYQPVSLDQYNQSLRDSVNAYYTHAMNDPRMYSEDVLKSTGEMSEKYLEAVEGVQEAQNNQIQAITSVENATEDVSAESAIVESDIGAEMISDISEAEECIDGGEDCEDGVDI